MAAARHNRPTIIVYGGTTLPGERTLDCPSLDAKKGDHINVGMAYVFSLEECY